MGDSQHFCAFLTSSNSNLMTQPTSLTSNAEQTQTSLILVLSLGHVWKKEAIVAPSQTYNAKPQAPASSVTIPKAPFHMRFSLFPQHCYWLQLLPEILKGQC